MNGVRKLFEQELLFRHMTSCNIARIIIATFHHQMALVVCACEKLVRDYWS
jgi:hypothetical protein